MVGETEPATGDADLPSILARGEGPSIAYRSRLGKRDVPGVVFFCGFRSDMTGGKARVVDQGCAVRGQACLRFDYRGHGASGGRFEDGTIGRWLDDGLAALDRLTEGRLILVGSSMGGWLALLAALRRPDRVAGLILVAPATDFTERLIWSRLGEAERTGLSRDGVLHVPSGYDPAGYPITRALIEEGRDHLLLDAAIPLLLPVHILHGMTDPDVPWRHSLVLAEALSSADVTITLVKDGDHRLVRPGDLARLDRALADLTQYLAARP